MKQNIQKLLAELVSYTMIKDSHISAESKEVLYRMHKEMERLAKSDDVDKQRDMITLFLGATLFALYIDDNKYPAQAKYYPGSTVKDALQPLPGNGAGLTEMYAIGAKALSNLPTAFNGDIFKIEVQNNNNFPPRHFFPELAAHADKIDLLVQFCAQNEDDLNVPHLEIPDPELSSSFIVTSSVGIALACGGAAAVLLMLALPALVPGLALSALTIGVAVASVGVFGGLTSLGIFTDCSRGKQNRTVDPVISEEPAVSPA